MGQLISGSKWPLGKKTYRQNTFWVRFKGKLCVRSINQTKQAGWQETSAIPSRHFPIMAAINFCMGSRGRPNKLCTRRVRSTRYAPPVLMCAITHFLSRVSILLLTRDIDIPILSVRLSVCPSVCLSVTRWYCMKTAQHVVIIFSPYGSPIIPVLRASNIFTKLIRQGHPQRGC